MPLHSTAACPSRLKLMLQCDTPGSTWATSLHGSRAGCCSALTAAAAAALAPRCMLLTTKDAVVCALVANDEVCVICRFGWVHAVPS